jgi:hypothetical protein
MPLESLRTYILGQLKSMLATMAPPTYWYAPQKVERFWLHPMNEKHYPHYSILTGDEDKSIDGSRGPVTLVSCELPVTIAGAAVANGTTNTEDRALMGERMLTDVERMLSALNGMTISGSPVQATVTRTQLEITEVEAPLLLVGIYALVRYRHQEGDPGTAG